MKQEQWDQTRRELHQTQEELGAPPDASKDGVILNDVMDFLATSRSSMSEEDLLKGMPVVKGDYVCFKVIDLQRFLKLHRRQDIEQRFLYRLLRLHGCEYSSANIKGKYVSVWKFPTSRLNIQTEEFAPARFADTPDEL